MEAALSAIKVIEPIRMMEDLPVYSEGVGGKINALENAEGA